MFIGYYYVWVLFSYLGIITSFISCIFLINSNIKLALICYMLTGLIDMFDGKFSNLFKRNSIEKKFGVQIDTVLDVFNFGAIPIFILYIYGLNNWIDLPFLIIYSICSTMRLAYFNTIVEDTKSKIYYGFPVTTMALYLPFTIVLSNIFASDPNLWVIRIMLLIISILYIANIKINKPTSKLFYILIIGVGLAILLGVTITF